MGIGSKVEKSILIWVKSTVKLCGKRDMQNYALNMIPIFTLTHKKKIKKL